MECLWETECLNGNKEEECPKCKRWKHLKKEDVTNVNDNYVYMDYKK